MNELEQLRQQIDRIDRQLLPLFLERMDVCSAVAEYKRSVGKPVLDSARERQVLADKLKLLSDPAREREVYEFFAAVMAISRDLQTRALRHEAGKQRIADLLKPSQPIQNPRVAFFGTAGSYSEDAAVACFSEQAERFCCPAFEDVFAAVADKSADYGVVPIENSSTGTIADVVDLFTAYPVSIVGEVDLPIRHCLLGLPDAALDKIRKVYSHEQGLLQCRDYLRTLGDVQLEECASTAMSARLVAEQGDPTLAAVAGRRNAALYGLKVLAENINVNDGNTTRFVVIGRQAEITPACDKISVAFTLPHESGELHRVLACFARGGLNLLKLESRPIPGKTFEYRFYVDYTGCLLDEQVRRVTDQVIEGTQEFQFLGNYCANRTRAVTER